LIPACGARDDPVARLGRSERVAEIEETASATT
jgi:hypothetical protein